MPETVLRTGLSMLGFRADQCAQPWRPYRSIVEAHEWSPHVQARADQTLEEWIWEYTSGLPRRTPIRWECVDSPLAPEVYLHAWHFLEPVLSTYEQTRTFQYLDFSIQVALNWSRQQPQSGLQPPSPWYDAAVGIRSYRLAYITDAGARSSRVSEALIERLLALSLEHAATLADDKRFATSAYHGLYTAAGQLAQARRLRELPGMEMAEDQARSRLHQVSDLVLAGERGSTGGCSDNQSVPLRTFFGLKESGLLAAPELAWLGGTSQRMTEGEMLLKADGTPPQDARLGDEKNTVHFDSIECLGQDVPAYGGHQAKESTMARASLYQIGRKQGTDKVIHGYLPHYEDLLESMRDDQFEMLEIGVHEGASVRMWHEYFSAAEIVGVDSKAIALKDDLPRYTFVQGSQADWTFLNKLGDDYAFRLIIDDGSHLWGHQIFTFQTLFPKLETGGIYVCEDIQTSFGEPSERYHGGAKESAAAYFFRIAQALTAGRAQEFKQTEDPLMHFFIKKIRAMTFIRHGVVIQA